MSFCRFLDLNLLTKNWIRDSLFTMKEWEPKKPDIEKSSRLAVRLGISQLVSFSLIGELKRKTQRVRWISCIPHF